MPIKRDFQRLQENGSATAAELREFVSQMHGRRPQEVLGLVAQSGLTQGLVLATVLTVAGIGLMTVVPYAWAQAFPEQKSASAEPASGGGQQADAAAAQPQTSAQATDAPAVDPTLDEPSQANKEDVLDKLGIGETKTSDPKTNPLEDKVDDLLKDLK